MDKNPIEQQNIEINIRMEGIKKEMTEIFGAYIKREDFISRYGSKEV